MAIPDFGNDVTQILTGYSHAGVVKRDGSVWAWGMGLGAICPEGNDPCPQVGSLTPVKLRGVGNDYLSISSGEYNFTLVKPDGSIYVIGFPQTNYGMNVDRTLALGGHYYFTHFPSLNLLTPPQKTDTDRILDWAEQDYANYFAPSGIATQSTAGYEFRYYPQTNSHLGAKDNRVWYLPPGAALENVVGAGSVAERLKEASEKGF